jgi:uncharacterized membrane protein
VESPENDLQALRAIVRDLAARVERLERKLDVGADSSIAAPSGVATVPTPPRPQEAAAASPPRAAVPPYPIIPAPSIRSTVDHETDLESRIGSHWLNRIGIAAVLIGVSYFLKFAFDNNWIGPSGRVAIGLVAGIAVVVWSERFRSHGYAFFSYSLKAVGIGAMYLSLWAAFHLYSLIPSGVAFVAMLLVTASTAALALAQDAQILAAFALTGGFATPFLISTGQNREVQLFSYLALLDVATLVMVARKPWRRLLVLSYVANLVLYIAWDAEFYNRTEINLTLTFATLFFAIFAAAPLVARRPDKEVSPFTAIPLVLAFVNAGVYFLQVYAMVEEIDKHAMAWFALGLAAVYIFLSRLTLDRFPDPETVEKLHFLHLALALGFITVAIPIRLDGHWITIGWIVEAGVLLWLADRIRSTFMSAFAVGALALGVVRLLVRIDTFNVTTLIFNSRVATFAVAIAVVAGTAWYGLRRNDEVGRQGAAVALVALNALALIAFSYEVSDYFARELSTTSTPYGRYSATNWSEVRSLRIEESFTYSALWMAYGALLMVVGFWRRSAFVRWQALVLIAVTIVKVFIYDVSQLDRGYRIISFIVLGILLLAISFVYQRDWLHLSSTRKTAGNASSSS